MSKPVTRNFCSEYKRTRGRPTYPKPITATFACRFWILVFKSLAKLVEAVRGVMIKVSSRGDQPNPQFSMQAVDRTSRAVAETRTTLDGPARSRPTKIGVTLVAMLLLGGLALESGRFLLVDEAERADVILVLAGETNSRPAKALQLAREGYAGRII